MQENKITMEDVEGLFGEAISRSVRDEYAPATTEKPLVSMSPLNRSSQKIKTITSMVKPLIREGKTVKQIKDLLKEQNYEKSHIETAMRKAKAEIREEDKVAKAKEKEKTMAKKPAKKVKKTFKEYVEEVTKS